MIVHGDFEVAVNDKEATVTHIAEAILSNGTLSLHGSIIEPNLASLRQPRRMLQAAHEAARVLVTTRAKQQPR